MGILQHAHVVMLSIGVPGGLSLTCFLSASDFLGEFRSCGWSTFVAIIWPRILLFIDFALPFKTPTTDAVEVVFVLALCDYDSVISCTFFS